MRNVYRILVIKPEGRDNLEDLGVDGRIILQSWRNWMGSCGLYSSGSG